MANAKKCDRCGKYYDEYIEEIWVTTHNKIRNIDGFALTEDGYVHHNMDICPMCMIKFVDWMNTFNPIIELTHLTNSDTDGRCEPVEE